MGKFLVIPSENKLKLLAKRDIHGTLGSKGLEQL